MAGLLRTIEHDRTDRNAHLGARVADKGRRLKGHEPVEAGLARVGVYVAGWVKSGKLAAVRGTVGKRRCWRIDIESAVCGKQAELFDQMMNAQSEET